MLIQHYCFTLNKALVVILKEILWFVYTGVTDHEERILHRWISAIDVHIYWRIQEGGWWLGTRDPRSNFYNFHAVWGGGMAK